MKKIYITLTTVFFLLTSLQVFAQAAPPASTPIDGGLGLLLAGGVGYGVKKLIDHRRKQQ